MGIEAVVFDLDGTLIDSDQALVDPFVHLGVPRDQISFGHPIEVECARLGLSVDDYVAAYDTEVVRPFPGADELIASLAGRCRWAVCSNKHPHSGRAELARLGWSPEVALFSDAFDGAAKRVEPVLALMDLASSEVLFVGDTDHDRSTAEEAGVRFAWAGWNPRTRATTPGGLVLDQPTDVLDLISVGR